METYRRQSNIVNKTKTQFIIFLIIGVVLVYYIYRYHETRKFVFSPTNFRNNTKFVLFWTKMFDSESFDFPLEGYELFEKCEYNNCYATHQKTLRNLEDYDALLFHIPAWLNWYEIIPRKRYAHQRYIFVALESPVYYPPNRGQYVYNNFHNWTMTYRLDSDVPYLYGIIEKKETNYTMPSVEFVKNKTKSVAWFVSNCNSFDRREELANKLSKYIDVDIYGKCGSLTCPRSSNCYEMLEKNYKFYLSFENSYCKDYITEKFFNIMELNVIPIVYGGGNYSAAAPPHSYINVEDFDSVESLAHYLKSLEDDPQSYLEYFEWKKHYYVSNIKQKVACQLCRKLNDPTQPRKSYADIISWWYNTDNSKCKTDKNLPSIVF